MRLIRLLLPALCAGVALAPATAQQPAAPARATPAAAPATPAPQAVYTGLLSLVRYDTPIAFSEGFAPTRQAAVRRDGPEAIDWPDFTLNGQPIFRGKSEERLPLKLHRSAEAASPFQLPSDDVIQPANHWLRAMDWRGGRRHIYTADRTARTANANETMSGRYELWTFPLRISGEGGPGVKNVALKYNSAVVYKKDGPWRSLTLLLPANELGRQYELTVDGRPPMKFDIGLMPVKLGGPRERLYTLNQLVAGDGPKVRVIITTRPDVFPHAKEWADDMGALKKAPPPVVKFDPPAGLARYVGVEVPRSPVTIYAAQLPYGQSGGFYKQGPTGFQGSIEQYAAHLAEMGFDAVFDQSAGLPDPRDANGFEARAAALGRHGVKLGLQYDSTWMRPSLQHPCLPIFSHTLPEWHAPLYRSLSLAAQRFARLPNFLGLSIGGNNSGYAADWYPAPPIPDRPWGEAMIEFMGKAQPTIPRPPTAGAPQWPFEYPAKTTEEFLKYVGRYDAAFQEYAYFAEAVAEASRRLVFTSGAFGSSPGVGARGGWPWGSLPGRAMFTGLNVLQAYDWNQTRAAKPMHNVALTDRLSSYWQKRTTWSLLDNYQFLYGREAYQRACALALTRGIQGVGTNFIAKPNGEAARPDVVAFQKEMHAWIHRYGGVYARLAPAASIGVFYGHHQAALRPVITEEAPSAERLYAGSHEGKVTEALFLCHAAGWPARAITFQEIMRGPLPPGMKAILVVGAPRSDSGWQWGPGLEKPLQQFVDRGGRIFTDDESFSPIPSTKPGLRVAAYQPQSNVDPTPLLLRRNAGNIQKLRAAMEGVAPPVAASADPTVWAIPSECGDVQYLTVVNQGFADGDEAREMLRPADPRATKPEVWKTKANASLYVKPQTGALSWHTTRPIYDVRAARKLTAEEAAQVDLTKDAFQWYALPPAEITAPELTVGKGINGFYETTVKTSGAKSVTGVPVKIAVKRGEESAEFFASTGFPTRLPLSERDPAGAYEITVTELLSGLTGRATVEVAPPPAAAALQSGVKIRDTAAVAKFATRKNTPLVVALTPEQEKNPKIAEQARALEAYYRTQKRSVSRGVVAPGGVVESLQPLKSPHRYPQWKTIPADLVLLGTPADNVLILDQARGEIFPWNFRAPPAGGAAEILYTRSAFAGECDVLNIIAPDAAGLEAATKTLTAVPASTAAAAVPTSIPAKN